MVAANGAPQGHALDAVRVSLHELDELPLPGKGGTRARWEALADIARGDLSQARLAEGHVDARAILFELGRADLCTDGQLLGVWAAEPHVLRATSEPGGWRLKGVKAWCSGSTGLDGALVTATGQDGPRLFFVEVDDLDPCKGSWLPLGMAGTQSDTIAFHDHWVPDDWAIGPPDAYVQRPGFHHGGCGVAACWWGGAVGVLDGLHRAVRMEGADPAALGLSAASLSAAGRVLGAAADAIDDSPGNAVLAERLAREVRLVVARAARTALDQAVAAMGASGLCHQPVHSGRVADLLVYLSQHRERSAAAAHGEDLRAGPLSFPWL